MVPLGVVMIAATALCAFMAVRTIDCPEHLVEGKSIFFAIFTQIQVWALGIPLQVILDQSSVDAVYLGRVVMISSFSMSMVLLVIGPRFFNFIVVELGFCGAAKKGRTRIGSGEVHVTGITTGDIRSSASSEKPGKNKLRKEGSDRFSSGEHQDSQINSEGTNQLTAEEILDQEDEDITNVGLYASIPLDDQPAGESA